MTYSPYEPAPPDPGERWSLNLPLAIGVVFVFLVAVIAWVVISSSRENDDGAAPPPTPPDVTATTIGAGPPIDPSATTAPSTSSTTPPLLPETTVAGAVTSPSAPPATAPPPTAPAATEPTPTPTPTPTTPVAPGDTVPGDLAVVGAPMARPVCQGEYITIIASAIGDQATAAGIRRVLDQYPDASYLRTDQSCDSLAQASASGEPIYVVFFGPFPEASDACASRSKGPSDAYAKQLVSGTGVSGAVSCG